METVDGGRRVSGVDVLITVTGCIFIIYVHTYKLLHVFQDSVVECITYAHVGKGISGNYLQILNIKYRRFNRMTYTSTEPL